MKSAPHSEQVCTPHHISYMDYARYDHNNVYALSTSNLYAWPDGVALSLNGKDQLLERGTAL